MAIQLFVQSLNRVAARLELPRDITKCRWQALDEASFDGLGKSIQLFLIHVQGYKKHVELPHTGWAGRSYSQTSQHRRL
jgi:hypothetical protein